MKRIIKALNQTDLGIKYLIFGFVSAAVACAVYGLVSFESWYPGLQIFFTKQTFDLIRSALDQGFGTFVIAPILFCGCGHLLLRNEFSAPRTLPDWFGAAAFWMLALAFVLLIGSCFASNKPQVPTADSWSVLTPLIPKGGAPNSMIVLYFASVLANLSFVITSISFIISFYACRMSGSTIRKLSVTSWLYLITAIFLLMSFALQLYAIHQITSAPEHGQAFFIKASDPLLLKHWYRGDIQQFLIFFPALAVVSAAVAKTSARAIVGNKAMIFSIYAMGLVALTGLLTTIEGGASLVHQYEVQIARIFLFSISLLVILSCWIATLFYASHLKITPTLWVIGFMFCNIVIGSIFVFTFMANPLNSSPNLFDSYFYSLSLNPTIPLTAIFAVFAFWYAFFEEITGKIYSPMLANLHFGFAFTGIGFKLSPLFTLGVIFLPSHLGEPKASPPNWYLLASFADYIIFASVVLSLMAYILARGNERTKDRSFVIS